MIQPSSIFHQGKQISHYSCGQGLPENAHTEKVETKQIRAGAVFDNDATLEGGAIFSLRNYIYRL